ncbi:conserved protein of unknown function [Cupriavidus taiwanensis]|uniref:hypothetical protein n=1 Tax=Cupriavidus taiwanensis TaxID=164546 RepID=UPI000E104741|nr:hypothetical protein [Cupriavidus taiwanensis]SPA43327.1 conserved protein of unknown function [Cupriavidus taiwanensis]
MQMSPKRGMKYRHPELVFGAKPARKRRQQAMSGARYKDQEKDLSGLPSIQVSMTFSKHVLRFLGITKFHTPSHGAYAAPAEARSGSAHHAEVAQHAGTPIPAVGMRRI